MTLTLVRLLEDPDALSEYRRELWDAIHSYAEAMFYGGGATTPEARQAAARMREERVERLQQILQYLE